ncbi:hypothetical protein R3P38DRAFT_3413228 [Favolaschia claudopus]|uniref:Uncharacterized protein n=1 Tax=Favolaschia claudopus TaxID=2862362 RepID=A0AAV9Z5C0_9AGAR
MEVDPPSLPSPASSPAPSPEPEPARNTGRMYIEIQYHPHSGLESKIISLDAATPTQPTAAPRPQQSIVPRSRRPWAPFQNRADFEWAETMYQNSPDNIKKQLKGIHGSWNPRGTDITIKTPDELQIYLEKARQYRYEFDETFEGEVRHFEFYYRDPWEWILELATDPSLANDIVWYPCRKYLVVDGNRQRLRDEQCANFCIAQQLHHSILQSKLPHIPGLHHCLAAMLIWLDEGRVTSRTNMYPILLRPLFLPSQIRNGSGNGGSIFVGSTVKDHRDPDTRTAQEKIDFAKFKRDVYHRVLRVIFVDSLRQRGLHGECVTCGDKIRRVLFPAIPIASLDGKEADMFTATRGPMAHFPCSCCLFRSDQLHDIDANRPNFPPRTGEDMRDIYEEAQALNKTNKQALLQQYGLHDTENAFWSLPNSDPCKSTSPDNLHPNESGKFGKHLWPKCQEVLANLGTKGLLTVNMHKVNRWPGLKHFENVTTKDLNDGQSYLDIEKCILPCIVQLLPKGSPWVHAIRAHIRYRMMLDLNCITDEQIERKEKYQTEYGKWCMKITEKYGYSFDFPKQHQCRHTSEAIRDKGVPKVYCTRVNEGYHQETREAVALGNHRNNDLQVARMDATKEAMARIRMTLDEYDKEEQERIETVAEHAAVPPESVPAAEAPSPEGDAPHWRLGSGGKLLDSKCAMNGIHWIDTKTRDAFDANLRRFLRNTFTDENLRDDGMDSIKIRPYKCIYIDFTSLEDFTGKCDVLRCNPDFQVNHEKRFDFVNDIALVRSVKASRWKPNTLWENCRLLENDRTMFILPRYFVRGAHMINAFGCRNEHSTYYLSDVVDGDWFLRAEN